MPGELPYSPDPDTRLYEMAETESQLRSEIMEREQRLAEITARKQKIQEMLSRADANSRGDAPQHVGEEGDFYLFRKPDGSTLRVPKPIMAPPSRVPVAHDSDPQTGLAIDYYDDPNKMSPKMRSMIAEKAQSAPSRVPVARDTDPQSGQVFEYYDDPNKMSPQMRTMIQSRAQAAPAGPTAEFAKQYPNLAALAQRHRK